MQEKEISFYENVCTKMCHDLSGLSMAISNSVEMLGDEGNDEDFKKMAVDIAKRGADGLNAKIRFFRVALGLSGNSSFEYEEIEKMVTNYFFTVSNKSKVEIEQGLSINSLKIKILFCAMVFFSSMVLGQFYVSLFEENERLVLKIKNSKPFLVLNKDLNADIESLLKDATPNNSMLILCKEIALKSGININFYVSGEEVTLVIE